MLQDVTATQRSVTGLYSVMEALMYMHTSSQVNNSFVMGLFNGELRPEEVFPFPEALTEEQLQNTAMFIDPITRFYEVWYELLG